MNAKQLRQFLRQQRRAIPPEHQQQHAFKVAQKLRQSPLFLHQHFACYWATDAELDLTPFIQMLLKAGKHVYLPVLKNTIKALDFVRYEVNTPMRYNRFGILEPDSDHYITTEQLDVMCLPLVAFAATGHRMGMGGGFYDRTLSACRHHQKPIRVGIAHQCQQWPQLPKRRWDIPLHWLATEQGLAAATHK